METILKIGAEDFTLNDVGQLRGHFEFDNNHTKRELENNEHYITYGITDILLKFK